MRFVVVEELAAQPIQLAGVDGGRNLDVELVADLHGTGVADFARRHDGAGDVLRQLVHFVEVVGGRERRLEGGGEADSTPRNKSDGKISRY